MANNCQVPTPPKYVDELLDYVGYTHNLYNKSVLENSCGEGNILKEIVRRYILSSIGDGYSNEQIIKGLEKDITGYDVDPKCIENCLVKLDYVAKEYGLVNIRWNVSVRDYLECEVSKYDYIIGNPPYITYHDLTLSQRVFVKERFESCKEGRFDYCYAFIEAGLRDLSDTGKLAYIIPYSVIRNKHADKIRLLIKKHIDGIVDYKGIQIFPNTMTSSIVVVCSNQSGNDMRYYNKKEDVHKTLEKDSLNGKWLFEEEQMGVRRFGDYFKVSNSVATLYNAAFVFEANEEDEMFYYLDGKKVEKGIVYDAVSPKSEKKYHSSQKRDKIIFPYKRIDGRVLSYFEDEFKRSFPGCYAYLKGKKDRLEMRKSSDGVQWYEYGRIQAINNIFVEKLIMSVVVTNSVKVYDVGNDTVPYAGVYIRALRSEEFDLNKAKEILQSASFYEYIKKCGTPTTPSSYRVSVKDIENFYF